ncbi:hypothetical protein GT347_08460 [Xylophilus rhododendri]|uniref:Uncharacterized protein n=1 Tax=Xylophilus rhododendri TaxID=2697032 RepID=A0A857J462_9BURK|nr:hypothetical protein [Xylophilus rhododendri]QHI98023.1 hypothetical protein GT347_08460 [Xylophilus rhododendri]
MKKALVFSMLAAAAVSAMAQSAPAGDSSGMGRVVRTAPVVQQVPGSQGKPENRLVGYDVTYEYGGHQYTTRMASDPGSYVQVEGNGQSQPQQALAQPSPSYSQPGVVEQGVVVGAGESYAAAPVVYAPAYAPAYAPVYAPAPIYAAPYPYYGGYGYGGVPLSLSLGFGFGRGYGGHGHGRWR